LVVITIIGILVAMLLPAVQSARESARCAQCKNNVKQLALGCHQHVSLHGIFPTGGWDWEWAGDPARGFHGKQPGGWLYNILPYIEQQALHDMGLVDPADMKTCVETPVQIFLCPTRHPGVGKATKRDNPYKNVTPKPVVAGKTDYAACGGSLPNYLGTGCNIPGSYSAADSLNPAFNWGSVYTESDGVIFRHSEVKPAQVLKGLTATYLIGERHMEASRYDGGTYCSNDQGWDQGYDFDSNRWTCGKFDIATGICNDDATYTHVPQIDLHEDVGRTGNYCEERFGSAHQAGFNMAMCDGSIHMISYAIDKNVHARLGSRKYTTPVDLSTVPMY
jgi:type II secretory pathway pseudopilin PulG